MPVIHITERDQVHPQIAQILRDDQTVTWILSPGLAWDPAMGDHAVHFDDETEVYTKWTPPGTTPAPVGPAPEPGGFDRRDYTAFADHQMPPREFVAYHYSFAAINMITGERIGVPVFRRGAWWDPEIVNEPRP